MQFISILTLTYAWNLFFLLFCANDANKKGKPYDLSDVK